MPFIRSAVSDFRKSEAYIDKKKRGVHTHESLWNLKMIAMVRWKRSKTDLIDHLCSSARTWYRTVLLLPGCLSIGILTRHLKLRLYYSDRNNEVHKKVRGRSATTCLPSPIIHSLHFHSRLSLSSKPQPLNNQISL